MSASGTITARHAVGIVLDEDDDDWIDPAEAQATHVGPPAGSPIVQPVAPIRPPAGRRSHAQIYVCTRLVGDSDAGKLLSWLLSWSRKATRKRGLPGRWNANPRAAILRGTGLTWKRYRRAREILIERDLVDFRLHFFGGKTHVFTRPGAALMPHFADAVTHCHGEEIRNKGHDSGHDTGHDSGHDLTPSILPSSHPSNPGTRNRASPGEGREGQPTREAAAPPSPHLSASPPARQIMLPQKRSEIEDAATAALTPRVQAVLGRQHLNMEALRAALCAALPAIPGPHGQRHPSAMYGDRWLRFSPEVLARTYVRYEACVARKNAKLVGIRPPATGGFGPLPDSEMTPEARAMLDRMRANPEEFRMKPWADEPDPYAEPA